MIFPSRLAKFQKNSLPQIYRAKPITNLIQSYCANEKKVAAQGERRALELFHLAAEYVPAYRDFLKKNHINHKKITNIRDFFSVPIINKKNYLRAYPIADMCWNGTLGPNYVFSSSSGSTGQPFLWPRGFEQELEGALTFETIFTEIFKVKQQKTLYVNCFAMGTWVAGPFCLASAEIMSQKGYKLQTITPGIDKEVTYSLIKELAASFDQIILSGYPPFIKDLLDGGSSRGINWKKYDIKFLFAAEGFSEEWRSHVHALVGAKDLLRTSINMYGSADAAILAHETPLTNAIRQYAQANNQLATLFNTNRTPTLAQYDPRLKYFEQVEGQLIFSTNAGLPLIRYSIGDEGDVVPYTTMMEKVKHIGYDPSVSLNRSDNWKLPFVYVFGRSDFTVSLYGLLIYPEHIKHGLEKPELMKKISGKFVLSIEHNDQYDPYLLVRVELSGNQQPSVGLQQQVQKAILHGLLEVNSEYFRLKQEMGKAVEPVIELVEQGNQEYFKQGAKQRWVKQ